MPLIVNPVYSLLAKIPMATGNSALYVLRTQICAFIGATSHTTTLFLLSGKSIEVEASVDEIEKWFEI